MNNEQLQRWLLAESRQTFEKALELAQPFETEEHHPLQLQMWPKAAN